MQRKSFVLAWRGVAWRGHTVNLFLIPVKILKGFKIIHFGAFSYQTQRSFYLTISNSFKLEFYIERGIYNRL